MYISLENFLIFILFFFCLFVCLFVCLFASFFLSFFDFLFIFCTLFFNCINCTFYFNLLHLSLTFPTSLINHIIQFSVIFNYIEWQHSASALFCVTWLYGVHNGTLIPNFTSFAANAHFNAWELPVSWKTASSAQWGDYLHPTGEANVETDNIHVLPKDYIHVRNIYCDTILET